MVKIIIRIIGIFLLIILQLSFFSKFSILGSFPNIVLILAIALALRSRLPDALLLAAVGGILIDLASPLRFGIYTIIAVFSVILVYYFVLKIIPTPDYSVAFLVFGGMILLSDLFLSLVTLSWPGWFLIINALINGVWGVLAYMLLLRIIRPENEIKII